MSPTKTCSMLRRAHSNRNLGRSDPHCRFRNAEPIADSGSPFAKHVQTAHALSVTETSKRSWFWEPEVVGNQVWKVTPLASLHALAVGWKGLIRRRKGLLHVMKGNPTTRTGAGSPDIGALALSLAYHGCQCTF